MSKRRNKNYNRQNANNRQQQNKTVYVPVYTDKDFQKDEAAFNDGMQKGKLNWESFQRLMIKDLVSNSKIL